MKVITLKNIKKLTADLTTFVILNDELNHNKCILNTDEYDDREVISIVPLDSNKMIIGITIK